VKTHADADAAVSFAKELTVATVQQSLSAQLKAKVSSQPDLQKATSEKPPLNELSYKTASTQGCFV